jgi:hypothetical protein
MRYYNIAQRKKHKKQEERKMEIREALENALRETGRLPKNGRAEIQSITTNRSDYVRVEVLTYRGRSKKPVMYWNICVDMARELIHWDTTTSYPIK